ncbi:hypothetical protein cyc_01243 [Cyclospora cayetanensis]|uniref:Uncharacterized protein n=1 Tax=Cyclospora cayetanensis TaxID=88456 RepID=A0A1D3D1W3_9EIME|nr:hypothetical protein cyc_01243 [Cyclospora cayetanensis]
MDALSAHIPEDGTNNQLAEEGLQGSQEGQQNNQESSNLVALSFTEAEEKKHKRKLQEFRQLMWSSWYYHDELLYSVLLNMQQGESLPADPQQVLIDHFGEYRDPILDVVEELTSTKESLMAERAQMEDVLTALETKREILKEQKCKQKLWKAMCKQGASITSLTIYQKLADKKKPKAPLKNVVFTQELFLHLLATLPQGMPAQILEYVCPTGEPMECLPSANLKDDGENPILNAVVYAMNHFQVKEA